MSGSKSHAFEEAQTIRGGDSVLNEQVRVPSRSSRWVTHDQERPQTLHNTALGVTRLELHKRKEVETWPLNKLLLASPFRGPTYRLNGKNSGPCVFIRAPWSIVQAAGRALLPGEKFECPYDLISKRGSVHVCPDSHCLCRAICMDFAIRSVPVMPFADAAL